MQAADVEYHKMQLFVNDLNNIISNDAIICINVACEKAIVSPNSRLVKLGENSYRMLVNAFIPRKYLHMKLLSRLLFNSTHTDVLKFFHHILKNIIHRIQIKNNVTQITFQSFRDTLTELCDNEGMYCCWPRRITDSDYLIGRDIELCLEVDFTVHI